MRKFTIFTVILTVVIVVVVAELFINQYLPNLKQNNSTSENLQLTLPDSLDVSGLGQANVLGSDIDYSSIPSSETENTDLQYEEITFDNTYEALPIPTDETGDGDFLIDGSYLDESFITDTLPSYMATGSDIPDFEDENFISFSQNVYLREDMIKSAGFTGAYLEDQGTSGFLYKTIYIDDLYDVEATKTSIRTDDIVLAKVYVFKIGTSAAVHQVYEVLKMRASEGLDVEINETNEFGVNSFYMNDARRDNVSFLTVRIGSLIYGFSYPKEYHAQIKNLITLLDLEF